VVGNVPIRGIAKQEQIEVRLDGERIKVFTIGGRSAPGRGGRGGRGGAGYGGAPADEPAPDRGGAYGDASGEQAKYELEAEQSLEVRLSLKAGLHLVGVSFVRQSMAEAELPIPARMPVGSIADNSDPNGQMQVDAVRIGPVH